MKNNYFLRAAAVLLAGCLIGLCIIPATLARFATEVPGEATRVRAGIFRVSLNSGTEDEPVWVHLGQGDIGEALPINLFAYLFDLQDSDGNAFDDDAPPSVWYVDEHEDRDSQFVAQAPSGPPIIAPGTGGQMRIEIVNFSEVAVRISMDLTEDEDDDDPAPAGPVIPIEWWDGDGWDDEFPGIPDDIEDTLAPLDGSEVVYLSWRWRFQRGGDEVRWFTESDVEDTDLGLDAAGGEFCEDDNPNPQPVPITYIIPLTVRAEQILPTN